MAQKDLGRVMQRILDSLRRYDHKPILRKALQTIVDDANRKGPRRQLGLLIEKLGTDMAETVVEQMVQEEQLSKEIVSKVERNNVRDRLVCLVYDTAMKMAHDVVMDGTLAQVRFLAKEKGLAKLHHQLEEMLDLGQE